MANILEYMRTTPPEMAREANPQSTRNEIRKEAREYGQFLARVKETAQQLELSDIIKEINKDIEFLCKWLIKFGIKDESGSNAAPDNK